MTVLEFAIFGAKVIVQAVSDSRSNRWSAGDDLVTMFLPEEERDHSMVLWSARTYNIATQLWYKQSSGKK
jgi:hypothetical protein